ncbi:MAG TPA: DsbA family oxidoreductase [Acidimicrobiales bacterium]|nr:DsbA family oxidoreductase [Acidimicrobiales bacterium]
MRIDIWSDVVCPWCFLGKRRIERALRFLPWGEEVEVRWRAYQLDPRASTVPGDLRVAIDRKYGPGGFDAMVRRLTPLGRDEGIGYAFERAQRVNTRDAHRLLAWAWETGGARAQGALKERLFLAYFSEGGNVADHAALAGYAGAAGLDPRAAAAVLADGTFDDHVTADIAVAREREVTGVPAFVVDDRFTIPGAQSVETFVAVLERARARAAG